VHIDSIADIKKEVVVIAHRLFPCDIVEINVDNVMGILTDVGGRTSHMAIMSEALEIPVVVGLESATDKIVDGDILIVDGNTGDVIINPDPETIIEYEEKKKYYNVYKSAIHEVSHLPAETLDGCKIKIKANIPKVAVIEMIRNHLFVFFLSFFLCFVLIFIIHTKITQRNF
jgi:phosphotransferase system enzyme I (PtsI)